MRLPRGLSLQTHLWQSERLTLYLAYQNGVFVATNVEKNLTCDMYLFLCYLHIGK